MPEWMPIIGFFAGLLVMIAAAIYGAIITRKMIRLVNRHHEANETIPGYAIGPLSNWYGVYNKYREQEHSSLDPQVRLSWIILGIGFALSMLSMALLYRMP